ncbi:hypothetical protein [Scytonema sp. PCC 10023]|uniref:hypothetical protein n=1 Tax=Scytonema sp. PCC 10023 TaxID=1680591 RepID=UPI0039C6E51A
MTDENLYETSKESLIIASRIEKRGELVVQKHLILEVCRTKFNDESPFYNYFPEKPGVVLKEICVDTREVLQEFKLSLAEAKTISVLLKQALE